MDSMANDNASNGGAVDADGGEEKMMSTGRNDHGLLHERNQEEEELRPLESELPDDEAQLENGVLGPGNADGQEKKIELADILAKDLNKIKRQNTVTHVLLGTVILMTAAWQVNEVSFLLWAQRKLSNPFKSLGDLIKGCYSLKLRGRRPVIESSPLPPVGVPDVARADLPTLLISGQHG